MRFFFYLVPSPVPSPVHVAKLTRGTSPVNLPDHDRETKNRSPFKFLQKNIFKKLHSQSDKELGVPVGVEMDVEPAKNVSSAVWGPEKESLPRLLEFSATTPGQSSEHGKVLTPKPTSHSKGTKPPTQERDDSDLPPVITLGEAPSIQLYDQDVVPQSARDSSADRAWGRPSLAEASQGTSASSTQDSSQTRSRDPSPQPFLPSNLQDFGDEIVFPKAKPKKTKKKGKPGMVVFSIFFYLFFFLQLYSWFRNTASVN